MQLKFYLSGFAIFLTSNLLNAQTASTINSTTEHQPSVISTTNEEGDWSFYLDEQNRVYYIDFEAIKVNLNDLLVINQAGEVVMKDNLWNLPVNTIYELDMKNLKPGKYEVKLRTYTGVIRKDIMIAE